MTHRGAVGSDARDGDGAGVMTSIPHKFFVKNFQMEQSIKLPKLGQYAAGNIFFKPEEETLKETLDKFEDIADQLDLRVLGWREVPKDSALLGPAAKSREPVILQPFVVVKSIYGDGNEPKADFEEKYDERVFERHLYVLRKRATHVIGLHNWFYLCSLSNKNIVYKGQLSPVQVYDYYHDLVNVDYEGHFALVHSRFSTNTFPSWDRAQPLRWAAHNGEINTLRGNKNWMRAREGVLKSEFFGDELDMLYPIVEDGGSDSAAFDNVLELLVINGVLSLPEAVMLMVPEAWQGNNHIDPAKQAFYEWAACMMEPWDGPALFVFSDGRYCGANLDRNGLRPCRYYVLNDDRIICASEVGTIAVEPSSIVQKGRLQPGRMLLVDTAAGRIIDDAELKQTVSTRQDFRAWMDSELLVMPNIYDKLVAKGTDISYQITESNVQLDPRLKAYGYSLEQITLLIAPMAADSKEALGSMGNDAPLACLAQQPRLLYEYFRQLFAQVTNPPIDPIREAVVMSLGSYVGPQGNLLEMSKEQCHRLLLPSPMLSHEEFNALMHITDIHRDWTVATVDITFLKEDGIPGYYEALDRINDHVTEAIERGDKIIVLSDRKMDAGRVPVSSLLATGMVHHHLVRNKWRAQAALVVETAEAREVHHMCVLVGYGADAICPYLAMECILKLNREGLVRKKMTKDQLIGNYKHSCDGGILKVMSKMGISTLQSYKGAQIFEALGIDDSVVDRCFTGTATRIRGMTFELIAQDAFAFHEKGFPSQSVSEIPGLAETGEYHWRDGGEPHVNDPTSIANIQDAVRANNDKSYEAYSKSEYEQIKNCTLRGLLDFDFETCNPIPIEQVEPWTEIVRRYCTGAMSYGSISMEAHSTLAVAMNRLGGKSNTGEGGEDAERSNPLENGDTMRSAIKQIASGRFGVTSNYIADSDELQIKMAQGAKPGEGGELPGHKVSRDIAKTRHSTEGVGLISPPPHHDIYSIEDLKQLIYDLKCANPRARVSVKLVSETGVGIVASGVAKAKADHILISGHDGGTGASRWTGIKYAGLPWELGLAETHQTLVLNDLRGRVIVQTDGQLRTGRDVAIACLLGAEEFGFATAPLIAMGCIMMRKCLEENTLVRTTSGIKKVKNVNIGDALYDADDREVLCTAVAQPANGPLHEISFLEFDSRNRVSFYCTLDHHLTLVSSACVPSCTSNTVTWLSRCDRGQTESREAGDLHLDILTDRFYRDLLDQADDSSAPIGPEKLHGYVDVVLDAHYHQGHDTYSAKIDTYLRLLAERELDNSQLLFREAMHSAVDHYASGLAVPPHDPLAGRSEVDAWEDLIDIGPPRFEDMQFRSSLPPSSSPPRSGSPTTAMDEQEIAAASSDYIPTSDMDTDEKDGEKFEKLRESLNNRCCNCGGFRKVFRRFASPEQAQYAHAILLGEHHHLIDPFIVRNGEEFCYTVSEFQQLCSNEVQKTHLKLYRSPLRYIPPQGPLAGNLLPIDPYYLGLWIGDGSTSQPIIASSDREFPVWAQSLVNSLNSTRPAGTRPVKLTQRLNNARGTLMANGYYAAVDVYTYRVSSDQNQSGDHWNPITSGLRAVGVFNDKSVGIPRAVFDAPEDARLAVIAGLVESDGCYVKSHNTYRVIQHGEGHRKIIYDLKKLALSCGISVTGVDEEEIIAGQYNSLGSEDTTRYIVYLGKGSEKFQQHLLLPRKRMTFQRGYYDHDTRPLKISGPTAGRFRAIEVSGGEFQLANRLVVKNCHLSGPHPPLRLRDRFTDFFQEHLPCRHRYTRRRASQEV